MKLLQFKLSDKPTKRFTAVFEMPDKKRRTTHFGQKFSDGGVPQTFLDGAPEAKRKAYLARHATDLRTKNPTRAGFLSYYVIWGPSRKLETNLKAFLKQFKIKDARS